MRRAAPAFKDTQVFDWDAEPKDERPSEFVPTTGYSSLSGYHTPTDVGAYRRPPTRRGIPVLAVAAVMIGLGAAALLGFLHLLKG
jgi:hypothetical protein